MTQQVRTGYRRHREAVWGLALLLVAAIAAIAIPFASGAAPAAPKTLVFDKQPANPWQKDTTITPAIAVKVINGTQGGKPTITATGAGTTSDFDFGEPVEQPSGTWSWPNAKPKATAPSGLYNLVVTLGSLTATSDSDSSPPADNDPFRVADFVCPPSCETTSNEPTGAQGKLNITNTLGSAVALDFEAGGGVASCDPWNRAFITTPSGDVFFPAVELTFTSGPGKMLQATYLIRNSEWTQTNTSRGNQDIDFCVGTKHQVASKNGPPPTGIPFTTKYGTPARWGCENPDTTCPESEQAFWGVIPVVANASKVTTDPAVCARGNVELPTGPGNALETWRSWTICIPFDWDISIRGG
jgi:hypothetical protein